MTTAAAVDWVAHHSVIVELNVRSYREEEAASNQRAQGAKGEKGGAESKD